MDVILVDELNQPLGTMGKMEVHEKALLHRAFSIFIFNSNGDMLLQQRAGTKYHSAGLWTNTCCSHPAPGTDTLAAAKKRLQEEMGFDTELKEVFHFIYKAPFENGLTEHEYDHVFIGEYDGKISPDADEVQSYSYQSLQQIKQSLSTQPEQFTEWFKIAFPKVEAYLASQAMPVK